MQQFNPQFVERHLIPLLQRILVDAFKNKLQPTGQKEYFHHLIEFTNLTELDRKLLYEAYFINRNDTVTPFVGEKEEVNEFLDYIQEHLRETADISQRHRFFMPVQNPQNTEEFLWPADVARNLHLMAYDIAGKFEKSRIAKALEQEERSGGSLLEIARKKALNAQGMMILVQNPDGTWRAIEQEEAQKLDSAVQFITLPSAQAQALMAAADPKTYYRTSQFGENTKTIENQKTPKQALIADFQKRRILALKENLKNMGLEVEGDIKFRNDVAIFGVRSASGQKAEVTVKAETPLTEKLELVFKFEENGIVREFRAREDQLEKFFSQEDGKQGDLKKAYQKAQSEEPNVSVGMPQGEVLAQEGQAPLTVEAVLAANEKRSAALKAADQPDDHAPDSSMRLDFVAKKENPANAQKPMVILAQHSAQAERQVPSSFGGSRNSRFAQTVRGRKQQQMAKRIISNGKFSTPLNQRPTSSAHQLRQPQEAVVVQTNAQPAAAPQQKKATSALGKALPIGLITGGSVAGILGGSAFAAISSVITNNLS